MPKALDSYWKMVHTILAAARKIKLICRKGKSMKYQDDQAGLIENWYKKYAYEMIHVAMSYVKDQSTAEDIVQMVFEKLLKKKHVLHFDCEEKGRVFLLKAVRNQCLDYLRAEKKSICVENISQVSDKRGQVAASPLHSVLEQEKAETLQWALMHVVNEHQRRVLFYQYYYGLSMNEISELMGVKPGTAAVWAKRGRDALKKYLAEEVAATKEPAPEKDEQETYGKEDSEA